MSATRMGTERADLDSVVVGSHLLEGPPWHQRPGMEGMREAVRQIEAVATGIDERVLVKVADVTWFHVRELDRDDPMLILDLLLPRDIDRMDFHGAFFGALRPILAHQDRKRLAIGFLPLD